MISWNKEKFASIIEEGKKVTIYADGRIECYTGIKPCKMGKGFFSLYNKLMQELAKEGKEEREEERKDFYLEASENCCAYYGLKY